MYRNATDFYILIFYPVTLLNSLISSSSFLVESFGFSIYSVMSSALLPYQFRCLLSLYILIAFASTSYTMLNKNGESGHHFLVLDLMRKVLSFSPPEYDAHCWFFLYGFYYVKVYSLETYFVENFLLQMDVVLCPLLFMHLLR